MKTITIFFLLIAFASVNAQTLKVPANDYSLQAGINSSTNVPIEKARIVARNFYLERVNLHSHHTRVTITGEFTIKQANEPVYYIFNMDDEGFIVISAEVNSFPVLGYSFEGIYHDNSKCPSFNDWMNNYSDQIVSIRENHYEPDQNITEAWAEYSNENAIRSQKEILDLEPLITAKWHQDYPYNTNCPYDGNIPDTNFVLLENQVLNLNKHVWSGCVATAAGMIMNYWRYPLHGAGVHDDSLSSYGHLLVNYAQATNDWSAMQDYPVYENNAVAQLIYHIGVAVNMVYTDTVSLALSTFLTEAYKDHYLYDPAVVHSPRSSSYSVWRSLLMLDLNNKWPIQYEGGGPQGGHSFVCDGYQGTDFFHMNWGWGGIYNGYFLLNELNPGVFTFNQNQGAILHIHPLSTGYPDYCSGQTTILDDNTGSIEDGSGPVLNYQDDADCSWLIAPDDSIASLTLNFVKFNLHESDYLRVYDGENTNAPLIGSYTGTALPESITASGKKLFLQFVSDDTLNANGFLAEYNTTEYPFCNDTLVYSDTAGVIDDGSDRFKYRNGSNCVWKLYRRWEDEIFLKFSQINTEANRDSISIYDLTGNTLLATYSGSYMTLPDTLKVQGSGILIVFKTDSAFRKGGWKANYQFFPATGTKENLQTKYKIFPNPARDYCMIETNSIQADDIELILYDTQGKALLLQTLRKPINYLNLSTLKPGIYLICLKTENEVMLRKLIVY
ncbi:MAG TPA: C10 family peptidase [Lentimicrobium sp.]|nr:C10 family peptidase [Lentimicrobium sp.]